MYNLFGKTEFKVSDKLTLRIPLVSEVKNCENNKFYTLIMSFICSTYDCLLTVEDLGVDFREMSDYNWFLCLFQAHFKNIEQQYWEMLFPNLNAKELFITANENNELFIENKEGVIIDEKIYTIISDVLRQIFGVEKYTEYRNMPDWKKNILIMDKRLELQQKIENKIATLI